jgi:hypothetical protein
MMTSRNEAGRHNRPVGRRGIDSRVSQQVARQRRIEPAEQIRPFSWHGDRRTAATLAIGKARDFAQVNRCVVRE